MAPAVAFLTDARHARWQGYMFIGTLLRSEPQQAGSAAPSVCAGPAGLPKSCRWAVK
jgi:hypothetical protein